MTGTGGEETSLSGTVLNSCFVSLHHSCEFWLGLVSQGLALRRIYCKVNREFKVWVDMQTVIFLPTRWSWYEMDLPKELYYNSNQGFSSWQTTQSFSTRWWQSEPLTELDRSWTVEFSFPADGLEISQWQSSGIAKLCSLECVQEFQWDHEAFWE